MGLTLAFYCLIVAGQIVGRALFEDTEAREAVVWAACVRPGAP